MTTLHCNASRCTALKPFSLRTRPNHSAAQGAAGRATLCHKHSHTRGAPSPPSPEMLQAAQPRQAGGQVPHVVAVQAKRGEAGQLAQRVWQLTAGARRARKVGSGKGCRDAEEASGPAGDEPASSVVVATMRGQCAKLGLDKAGVRT